MMNHESFSRVLPKNESIEVTARKYGDMLNLLKGEFDNIDPKYRVTALDFQGLVPNSTEEDFLKWIEREIEVKPELILENGSTEASVESYKILNYAYQRGKDFLQNTLKYSEEEISVGPESISSKKDIFNLLKKTVLIGNTDGLSKALLYCRLVKATLAAYETLKNDAETLKNNATAFEDSLISPVSTSNVKNTPLILLKENEQGKKFYAADHGGLKGNITTRGKNFEKAMLRFITRVESSAESALKDGIASRITIEENQALELIPILCKWLIDNMKVNFINIENQSFLSSEQEKEIEKTLSDFLSKNKFNLAESHTSDPTSMGDFKALKMTGILQFPEEENTQAVRSHARQFEIQLVPPNNKNESGAMHHSIYDALKLTVARTRLDGGCSEQAFNEFIKDASRDSGISEKKIKYYLLETENAPIVKLKKKNSKKEVWTYIAHSVYSRWNRIGWVDSSLYSDIEFAKEKNKN